MALDITPYALSTQYVVIKYKTSAAARVQILATTEGNEIGGHYNLSPVADGAWHTAIIDLGNISAGYNVGDAVTFFRVDVCEDAVGQSITIDYIEFVSDPAEIPGEVLVGKWQMAIDTLLADGVDAAKNPTSSEAGPMQSVAINGTVLELSGWVAVDGCATLPGLFYTVVDSEGNVTTKTISLGDERTDATAVVVGQGYNASTKAYKVVPAINLSDWAKETVTLSLSLILDDAGHTVVIYVATVNVGDEVRPEYADGEALKALVSAGYTTTLNDDGSVTITQNGGADGAITLTSLTASGTFKYAIVRYKTTDTAEIIVYATTAGKGHKENYVTLKADGQWHVIAIDLEAAGSYTAGDALSLFRFDFNEGGGNAGKAITFDFVWLVEDPSEIELESGEKIQHVIATKNNVDYVYADNSEATNYNAATSINATTVKYVGWFGVAKKDIAGVSYVVTDADGETTEVALEASEEAANKFLKGADAVQTAVAGLGEGTVGYSVNFTADLSAWAGDTVTLSVVAEAVDGVVAETYSITVTVPTAAAE